MTAQFHVESGFSIIGRGFILAGEIVDGKVSVGMKAMLPANWVMGDSVRIDGLEMIKTTSETKVGLLLKCDEQAVNQWKKVAVAGHTIDVVDS